MHSRFVKIITFVAVMTMLVVGATMALAGDEPAKPAEVKKTHAYVGTKTCKMCHNSEAQGKIFDKWLSTKHANAVAALDSAKGERTNAKCLKCHTTGYGTANGYDKVAEKQGAQDLGSVGCEACHGPGADYKAMGVMKDKAAAVAAGLVIPTEATCKTCHNADSPTFKSFDYAKAYAQIEHHIPKAAPAPK